MEITPINPDLSLEEAQDIVGKLTQKGKKNLLEALQAFTPAEYLEDSIYLHHAPETVKIYYSTLSHDDKAALQKIFKYTEEGIDVNFNGQTVYFEKENITVTDDLLVPGKIDRVGHETFFNREALYTYTNQYKIPMPTSEIYEALAKCMPAQDYKNKATGSVAVFQLYKMLGANMTGMGYHSARSTYSYPPISNGGVRSISPGSRGESGRALHSRSTKGVIPNLINSVMMPARALRSHFHKK